MRIIFCADPLNITRPLLGTGKAGLTRHEASGQSSGIHFSGVRGRLAWADWSGRMALCFWLFPSSHFIYVFLIAEGFFEIDMKVVGEVEQVAEDIGKFLDRKSTRLNSSH